NVTLDESGYETGEKKLTGTFKGKLDAVTINNLPALRLVGTWTSAKNQKSLAVNLKELNFGFGGLKLIDKKSKDGGNKARYKIVSEVPQLAGDDVSKVEKFNRAINNFIGKYTDEFKAGYPEVPGQSSAMTDISYTVTAANKDLISILFTKLQDSGGVHPNTNTLSFNYDLNRNEVLRLDDLFIPKSNYLNIISDYAIKELKKLDTTDRVDEGASA